VWQMLPGELKTGTDKKSSSSSTRTSGS
jgi:hypothetical protein